MPQGVRVRVPSQAPNQATSPARTIATVYCFLENTMHREPLLKLLDSYKTYNAEEDHTRTHMSEFIRKHPDCFERTCREGHITASAWIINFTGDQFLMTLHKKRKLWLPLGGHSDGDCDIHRTALKEAQEESGLTSLNFVIQNIFSIDVHDFITRKEPLHQHYDFNFLLQIQNRNDTIKISDESIDLRWFSELPESVRTIENLNRLYLKWKRWTEDKAKN